MDNLFQQCWLIASDLHARNFGLRPAINVSILSMGNFFQWFWLITQRLIDQDTSDPHAQNFILGPVIDAHNLICG